MAAFPVAKLAGLLLKQISKPIANISKEKAKNSFFFRTYVCMPPAQVYHWCEVKMKMWVMNLGRPVEIPKLNEQMAIELGANLLGEGIIFSIAAGILCAEYIRQVNKEAGKEQARLDSLQELSDRIRDLEVENFRRDAQLRELNRLLLSQQGRPIPPETAAPISAQVKKNCFYRNEMK